MDQNEPPLTYCDANELPALEAGQWCEARDGGWGLTWARSWAQFSCASEWLFQVCAGSERDGWGLGRKTSVLAINRKT